MASLHFHNSVARKLEKASEEMGTRAFTADEIEGGQFVDAMLDVLRIDPTKIPLYSLFFSKCGEYYRKHKYDIPDDEAQTLFETFEAIIEE